MQADHSQHFVAGAGAAAGAATAAHSGGPNYVQQSTWNASAGASVAKVVTNGHVQYVPVQYVAPSAVVTAAAAGGVAGGSTASVTAFPTTWGPVAGSNNSTSSSSYDPPPIATGEDGSADCPLLVLEEGQIVDSRSGGGGDGDGCDSDGSDDDESDSDGSDGDGGEISGNPSPVPNGSYAAGTGLPTLSDGSSHAIRGSAINVGEARDSVRAVGAPGHQQVFRPGRGRDRWEFSDPRRSATPLGRGAGGSRGTGVRREDSSKETAGRRGASSGVQEFQLWAGRGGRRGAGRGRFSERWGDKVLPGRGIGVTETISRGEHERAARERDCNSDRNNIDRENGQDIGDGGHDGRSGPHNGGAQPSRQGDGGKRGRDDMNPALQNSRAKYAARDGHGDVAGSSRGSERARDPRGTRAAAPAARGRRLERAPVDEDRDRSRSPSVGQDRGPPQPPVSSPAPAPTMPVSQPPSPLPLSPPPLLNHAPLHRSEAASRAPPPMPPCAPPGPSSLPHPPEDSPRTVYAPPTLQQPMNVLVPVPVGAPPLVALPPLVAPHQLPAPALVTAPPAAPAPVAMLLPMATLPPSTSTTPAAATVAPLRGCLKGPSSSSRGRKTVRVSNEEPSSQPAPIFSSDDEDAATGGGGARDMRGEWPHEFKFLPKLGRACSVCSKDFVRICTACGKCMECFRGGNRECVDGAKDAIPERRLSPPPAQGLREIPDEREWPEYPKTMTRLDLHADETVAKRPNGVASGGCSPPPGLVCVPVFLPCLLLRSTRAILLLFFGWSERYVFRTYISRLLRGERVIVVFV